tara:strand:- start:214 stop:789 length:576 start_codon:yes stop_codon:yes gene_type:complete
MRRTSYIEAFSRFMLWIALMSIIFILITSNISCSAVESINNNATKIHKLSGSSEERFELISDLTNDTDINKQTKQGIIEQQNIQDSVASIRNVLPRVEDKESGWTIMVGRVSLAVILITTFLIFWQTGIGTLIKRLLYSVMFFIPSKTKRQVEMDLKVADENNPMTMREVIANRRSDTAYNMAYKKLRNSK